jgi:hypothetical protein
MYRGPSEYELPRVPANRLMVTSSQNLKKLDRDQTSTKRGISNRGEDYIVVPTNMMEQVLTLENQGSEEDAAAMMMPGLKPFKAKRLDEPISVTFERI